MSPPVLPSQSEHGPARNAEVDALNDREGLRFVRVGPVGKRGMREHHARVLRQAIGRLPSQKPLEEGAFK